MHKYIHMYREREATSIPATHRSSGAGENFDMPSFSDTVFGFLDENYPLSGNSSGESVEDGRWGDEEENEGEEESPTISQEKKAFWDVQEQLLYGILCRTSSIETKVRNATTEALRQLESARHECGCGRAAGGGKACWDCRRREIHSQLCNAGFNCSIRKSKWKSSPEIPSGEHTYLEVVDKSSSNKGEVRVVIELNFRAEFEMARASPEYNHLITRLPEVYVGKPERLKNLIKIVCGAAKKCMKEKKMHLGPWREHKYMQAKWLGTCSPSVITWTARNSHQSTKPRASMLTLTLIDKLPRPLSSCRSCMINM